MRRARWTIAVLLVAVAGLTGCSAGGSSAAREGSGGFPLTVQNCGREVTFDKPAERVVAIAADAAGLVGAAGGADKIVAYGESYEGEPLGPAQQAVSRVPKISPEKAPSLEVILAQRPDLVVTYGLTETTPDALSAAGVKTLFITGYCDGNAAPNARRGDESPFELLYQDVELLGKVIGTEQQATRTAQDMRQRVESVRQSGSGIGSGRTAVAAVKNQRVPAINFFYTAQGYLAVEGLEKLAKQLAV